MIDDTFIFLERYGELRFSHSGSLVPLIREGRAKCRIRSDTDLPCRHYQEIYESRAKMLERKPEEEIDEMRREFESLAFSLSESPDEPCCLWIFETPSVRFSIFEMVDSKKIAGCFLRDNIK